MKPYKKDQLGVFNPVTGKQIIVMIGDAWIPGQSGRTTTESYIVKPINDSVIEINDGVNQGICKLVGKSDPTTLLEGEVRIPLQTDTIIDQDLGGHITDAILYRSAQPDVPPSWPVADEQPKVGDILNIVSGGSTTPAIITVKNVMSVHSSFSDNATPLDVGLLRLYDSNGNQVTSLPTGSGLNNGTFRLSLPSPLQYDGVRAYITIIINNNQISEIKISTDDTGTRYMLQDVEAINQWFADTSSQEAGGSIFFQTFDDFTGNQYDLIGSSPLTYRIEFDDQYIHGMITAIDISDQGSGYDQTFGAVDIRHPNDPIGQNQPMRPIITPMGTLGSPTGIPVNFIVNNGGVYSGSFYPGSQFDINTSTGSGIVSAVAGFSAKISKTYNVANGLLGGDNPQPGPGIQTGYGTGYNPTDSQITFPFIPPIDPNGVPAIVSVWIGRAGSDGGSAGQVEQVNINSGFGYSLNDLFLIWPSSTFLDGNEHHIFEPWRLTSYPSGVTVTFDHTDFDSMTATSIALLDFGSATGYDITDTIDGSAGSAPEWDPLLDITLVFDNEFLAPESFRHAKNIQTHLVKTFEGEVVKWNNIQIPFRTFDPHFATTPIILREGKIQTDD